MVERKTRENIWCLFWTEFDCLVRVERGQGGEFLVQQGREVYLGSRRGK